MEYFSVFVEDRQTHQRVCVLDMASRTEAMDLCRTLDYLNSCNVYFLSNNFYQGNARRKGGRRDRRA